jgi:uroporphyrinogen decarboxylase
MINIDNLKIKPSPDFSRLEKSLTRRELPDRVPFYDPFSNLVKSLFGERVKKNECSSEEEYGFRVEIEYWYRLGYDFAPGGINNFGLLGFKEVETAKGKDKYGNRSYRGAASSLMNDDTDYERYEWPCVGSFDFDRIVRQSKFLYPGMKLIVNSRGVFENVVGMMGYENLCYCIMEKPDFFKKVCDRVGNIVLEYLTTCAGMSAVGAILVFEDLGFKTQTMISPGMLCEFVFPWHKKFTKAAHAYGKPALLHACGYLRDVHDDIIAAGYDAKQSFEDVIEPVWDFKKRYAGRISSLGGFDMDKLTRMNEAEVRKHTLFLIDACAPDGGFAMGTGNSIADYIPVENYLAMLEEAWLYGRY